MHTSVPIIPITQLNMVGSTLPRAHWTYPLHDFLIWCSSTDLWVILTSALVINDVVQQVRQDESLQKII